MSTHSFELAECEVPEECRNCKFCGQRCMEAEYPVKGDWYGRGHVIRIYALCDEAEKSAGTIPISGTATLPNGEQFELAEPIDKDDFRTPFLPPDEAIAYFNEHFGSDA